MEHFNRFRNFNRIGKNFDTCHHVVHSSLENIFINLICNCTKKAYIKYRPFSRLKFASHSILVKLDVSSPSFLDTASTWPNMAIRSTPVITLSKKEGRKNTIPRIDYSASFIILINTRKSINRVSRVAV